MSKPYRAAALAVVVVLSGACAARAVEGSLPVVTVHAPSADLRLEVAATPPTREYGLMNRTSVPEHAGMIFVFEQDAPIDFWMKNTLVPLDMIFVAEDGTVRQVYSNVPVLAPGVPDSKIPLEGGVAKYVIELNAGEAARDGLVAGAKLDLASVPAPSKESP